MSITPEDLRKAMRNWASGIAIVTASYKGEKHGMTVSSFTSLSLDPPLISVSLYKTSRTHALVSAAGQFGITILAADQKDISDRFAGRIPDNEDRFTGLELEKLSSETPFISGALTFFDCRVTQEIPCGTNTLFIAGIVDAKSRDDGDPLVYFNQKYQKLD